MPINLQKGQTINLEKSQYDLSQVTIGLGWDIRKPQESGFLGRLLSNPAEEFDLDAIAFLLDANEKLRNVGSDRLQGGDVIFFNNQQHSSGTIWLTGDNRTGAGEGDDEQIIVRLNSIGPEFHKIVFLVDIYKGKERNQHFGLVENSFIRAVDAKGQEMARYDISREPSFKGIGTLIFAEVYRRGEGWKFRALGEPQQVESFVETLRNRYL
ncbi:MAG: TerD family protein [SAR324 cluster bacterium]|nr:TerD family protein [SAR324 cluster bacterium]